MALRGAGRLGLDAISWFANEVGAYPVQYLRCISSAELVNLPPAMAFEQANLPLPIPDMSAISAEAPLLPVSEFNWKGVLGLAVAGGAFWAAHAWATQPANSALKDDVGHSIVLGNSSSVIEIEEPLDIDWEIEPKVESQMTAKAKQESATPLPDMDKEAMQQAMLDVVNKLNHMIQTYQPIKEHTAKAYQSSADEPSQEAMLKAATEVAQTIKKTFESTELPMKLSAAVQNLEKSLKSLEAQGAHVQQNATQKRQRTTFLPIQTLKPQTTSSHPAHSSPQGPKAHEKEPEKDTKSRSKP